FYGADLAWTHLALGTLAWKTGKHAEAERAWKTAFEGLESVLRGGASETFRSQLANACLRVGEVYYELALWEEALPYYARALELNPTSSTEFRNYALLLIGKNDDVEYRRVCAK